MTRLLSVGLSLVATIALGVGVGGWLITQDGFDEPVPISWYKFNNETECDNGYYEDTMGFCHGTQAVVASRASYTNIYGTGALRFDGVDDHIDLGTPTFFGGKAGSISLWFKSEATSNYRAMFTQPNYNGIEFRSESGSRAPRLMSNGNAATNIITGSTLSWPSPWFNVIATFDGTNATIYTNSVVDVGPSGKGMDFSAADGSLAAIGIRASSGAYPFHGFIDDVKIYNFALTQAQVTWLYETGRQ